MLGILFLYGAALLAQVSFGSVESSVSHAAEVARLKLEIAELRQLIRVTATASDGPERRLLPENTLAGNLKKKNVDFAVQAAYTKNKKEYDDLGAAMDSCWLIMCGAIVMFMHPGFAMLETGSSRAKNAQSVLFKNMLNVTVGSVAWYLTGFAFAYGELSNKFVGGVGGDGFAAKGFLQTDSDGNMAIAKEQSKMLAWFFQWAFCTAAATIVSGAVAQRVQSIAYTIYAFIMASFIYPVIVAWTWNYGWVSEIGDVGFMDFAGSGIVHLTGGVSALCGAIILGARSDWSPGDPAFAPHNVPLVVLGTFILWFGWYGFNCGSTLSMHDAGTGALAAQVAMNTTVSAAVGGITVFAVQYALLRRYDVTAMCNGILAGLVSITAGCGNVETGSAFTIGIVGGIVYKGSSTLVQKLKIDDPVDAWSVHGSCGIWGVLAAALFDWGNGFDHFHGWSGFNCMTNDAGSCRTGIGGTALGANIAMILAIVAWAGGLSSMVFGILKVTGLLRVVPETEALGNDAVHHSPPKAYNMGD